MSGAEFIATERLRQIRQEGFTHGHDDTHPEGCLTAAADCYMYLTHTLEAPDNIGPLVWPWHPRWFKPSPDPRRNLVKAGALYLAEAERFDRQSRPDQAERCREMAGQLARTIDAWAERGGR